ncbi:MAG TPA: hypothetical protein VGS41_04395 [Chthonomonadales bacterium]|nr:hypothetical protein [Chthonomonadales bacterium]
MFLINQQPAAGLQIVRLLEGVIASNHSIISGPLVWYLWTIGLAPQATQWLSSRQARHLGAAGKQRHVFL